MGVIAILLSLCLLIFFAYRGVSVLILAPVLSMLAIALSPEVGEPTVLQSLSFQFIPGLINYAKAMYPIFLVGAIFGKLMGVTGAAASIAHFISTHLGNKYAILSTVLATALLTYGGVSLFVVVFAMYPIGAALFRDADIPKKLLPATIALGAFTFTMTALPGAPQVINTMPIPYFHTTIYAAPVLGITASIIMFGLGMWFLTAIEHKYRRANEGYGDHPDEKFHSSTVRLPNFYLSIVPLFIVFISQFALTKYWANPDVIERLKSTGLVSKIVTTTDGVDAITTSVSYIDGTWPVFIGLAIASLFVIAVFYKQITNLSQTTFDGAVGALLPLFNTASEVGYGGVIKGLAAFGTLKGAITALSIAPLFKVAIATTLLAGIVGSSSGGTGLALGAFADTFQSWNINPQVLHRIMIIAAGGLDSFPHSGAVVTLFAVTQINIKKGYKYVGVITMGIPLIAVFAIIILHLVTGLV